MSACVSGEGGGGGWRLSLGAISCYCQLSWDWTDSVLTINNNNNNDYLQRLTRTGPKRLHVLYKHIFVKIQCIQHGCTHTRGTHTQTRTRMHTHTDTTEYTEVAYQGNLQFPWSQCSPSEWVPTELGAHNSCEASAHWMGPNWTGCSHKVSHCSPGAAHNQQFCGSTVCSRRSQAWLLCAHTGPRPDYCVLTTALVTT